MSCVRPILPVLRAKGIMKSMVTRSLHSNHLILPDAPVAPSTPSYPERLATFLPYWDTNIATARQLASVGHVSDRPPLEALEEGSRCVQCASFVPRASSVRAFEGSPSSKGDAKLSQGFQLHHPRCDWLAIRIPLDPHSVLGLQGGRINDMKSRFEKMPSRTIETAQHAPSTQVSPLFTLPTELRLQIYSYVLPRMSSTTTIQPLNRDSARIVTEEGASKVGPRDLTKTNILCTCRAVHSEGLDLLFSSIAYRFPSTKVLYLFLRHIGPHGRSLLRSVDVHAGGREDAIAFALLGSCETLRCMTIRLFRSTLLPPSPPIWMADGMACLLDISGLEEVKFGECGSERNYSLSEDSCDAVILRRELTRKRGSPGGLRWVDGRLDL